MTGRDRDQAATPLTMSVRLIWLQRAGLTVLLVLLVLLAREAAIHSIDFPVYHRAARQVIAGHYEFYPVEAYGGTPGPSQGFRYAPAIAFLFVPFGWLPLELAALAFFALKLAALWYVGATVARHVGLSESEAAGLPDRIPDRGGIHRRGIAVRQRPFPLHCADGVRLRQGRGGVHSLPAAALAVAIATKITPLALLVYFALRRRATICLATVAILALLILAPAVVMGPAANARELRAFATYAAEKIDEGDNYSLRGVLVRHLTAGHADVSISKRAWPICHRR